MVTPAAMPKSSYPRRLDRPAGWGLFGCPMRNLPPGVVECTPSRDPARRGANALQEELLLAHRLYGG